MTNLERNKIIQKAIGEVQKQLKEEQFPCLYQGCRENAVKSHSQQKERQLRVIAERGIVYALNRNLYQNLYKIVDPHKRGFSVCIQKMGVDEASIFPGYCASHDKEVFKHIEDQKLCPNDKKQAALFSLRAFSYEFASKRYGDFILQYILNKLGTLMPHGERDSIERRQKDIKSYLDKNGHYYLRKTFESIFKNDFTKFEVMWKVIPRNILISSCCCINPLLDNYTSWPLKKVHPVLTFNIVPEAKKTHLIFCWFKEHHAQVERILHASKDDKRFESLINRLSFAESEDTCISPRLWDGLTKTTKKKVCNAMRDASFRGKLKENKIPKIIRL